MRGWIPNFGAGNSLGRLRCAPCCQALSKKVCRGIFRGTPQSIDLQVIGFRKHTDKLEFARRAGGQVVTSVVCNRSQPDPLGIVLRFGKLEFEEGSAGPEQHCHSEPVRLSGVGISIEFWAAHRHTVCSFCTVSQNSSTRSDTSIRGIATPVCALARNDREFDKFPICVCYTELHR